MISNKLKTTLRKMCETYTFNEVVDYLKKEDISYKLNTHSDDEGIGKVLIIDDVMIVFRITKTLHYAFLIEEQLVEDKQ